MTITWSRISCERGTGNFEEEKPIQTLESIIMNEIYIVVYNLQHVNHFSVERLLWAKAWGVWRGQSIGIIHKWRHVDVEISLTPSDLCHARMSVLLTTPCIVTKKSYPSLYLCDVIFEFSHSSKRLPLKSPHIIAHTFPWS